MKKDQELRELFEQLKCLAEYNKEQVGKIALVVDRKIKEVSSEEELMEVLNQVDLKKKKKGPSDA